MEADLKMAPASNAHDRDDTNLLPPGLLTLICPKLEGIAHLPQSWWKHAHALVQKKKANEGIDADGDELAA